MRKFLVTITLLVALVGSAFAKTTKVGDKQYHIKNNNLDATYTVLSETEPLIITNEMFNLFGMPMIIENNTEIDPEVASLTKKFGYTIAYFDLFVVINAYNKNTDSIDTIIWS